jgi:hypothetical protein
VVINDIDLDLDEVIVIGFKEPVPPGKIFVVEVLSVVEIFVHLWVLGGRCTSGLDASSGGGNETLIVVRIRLHKVDRKQRTLVSLGLGTRVLKL